MKGIALGIGAIDWCLSLALFAIVIGCFGLCFDYSLDVYFGKDISWPIDCIAGTFASAIVVPATVIAIVLICCGTETPIVDC